MRIACLQFSPQVGDVENNLHRADAVLSKASKDDLDDLDLLVLPELAFSGYNFKSLQQISPFLEYAGSGISSLWARTIALKYNCTVSVGYPEKVDVATRWPCSPEYYNAAIVVNGDGETVTNYRKSFLYYIDETWALEGKEGFFQGYIPGLGHTAMGICMDLNPYKFEAPWNAFEFAFHILEMEANLVVVSMAWVTREDSRKFSRTPQEPDMETLTYWVQRLEPIIRAENEDEIIVVFCNRAGVEGEVTYAGTSAVLGVKAGEVSVYGLLGRGVKELLVVDTDKPPFGKLVHRPDEEGKVDNAMADDSQPPVGIMHDTSMEGDAKAKNDDLPALSPSSLPLRSPTPVSSPPANSSASPTSTSPKRQKPASPKLQIPADAGSLASSSNPPRSSAGQQVKEDATTQRSVTESPNVETPTAPSPTPLAIRPKLMIPPTPPIRAVRDSTPYPHDGLPPWRSLILGGNPVKSDCLSPALESPGVETPSAPSPTPHVMRPKLMIPSQPVLTVRGDTPYPHDELGKGQAFIFGGNVTIRNCDLSPTTPFIEYFEESPLSATFTKYYWMPSQSAMQTPLEQRKTPYLPDSPTLRTRTPLRSGPTPSNGRDSARPQELLDSQRGTPAGPGRPPSRASKTTAKDQTADIQPSPPPRSQSRTDYREPPEEDHTRHPAWPAVQERLKALERAPSSILEERPDPPVKDYPNYGRPRSPKSRNASRNRQPEVDSILERRLSLSRASIPIAASPSCFTEQTSGPASVSRPDSRLGRRVGTETPVAWRITGKGNNKQPRSRSFSSETRFRGVTAASNMSAGAGNAIKRPGTALGVRSSSAIGIRLGSIPTGLTRPGTWPDTSLHVRRVSRGRQLGSATCWQQRSNSIDVPRREAASVGYSQGPDYPIPANTTNKKQTLSN